jgi:uncharacterized protein (TIGR03437 family)
VKRTLLVLSVIVSLYSLAALKPHRLFSQAQTSTDDVSLQQLPVPTNVIGTFIRSASNDGKRIVFDSINDYNGRNVDSNNEIWVYDVDTRSIIMITDTAFLKDPADSTKTILEVNNNTPVISGDGTKIVFVSNADLGGTTNPDGNYEVFMASIPRGATTATITRLTDTGADFDGETVKQIASNYSPTLNDDGSVVSFLSTRKTFNAIAGGPAAYAALQEGPAGSQTAPDGNGELFLINQTTKVYSQVTVTRDIDAKPAFTVLGFNASPHFSGDGRTLAFVSGFNFPGANANKNTDFNGEIFLYRVGDPFNTFTQVTDTTGVALVPVLDINFGIFNIDPTAPMNLLPPFTEPLNRDGSLMAFESGGNFDNGNADRTRELWLYNTAGKTFTKLTNQTVANPAAPTQAELGKIDYNLRPSLNSTGSMISFASVLNLTPAATSGIKTDNADGSREVFRYEIATQKFRQITFADKSGFVLDQRDAGVSPFADDSGTLLTFSFDASLLAPRATAISEPFQALLRPVTGQSGVAAKLANAASFDTAQVARGSLVAAFGSTLSDTSGGPTTPVLPFILNGVSATVDGLAANMIFTSPGQVNFVVPAGAAPGDAVNFSINNNGVISTGTVKIVDAAPGVFAANGAGNGAAAAQCAQVTPDGLGLTISQPPCSIGNTAQANTLIIYGTGWRNATGLQVKIGDQTLTPTFSGPQPNFAGLDQMNVNLTEPLADKADLEVVVTIPGTTPIDSNKTTASFISGDQPLTIINSASFESGFVARGSAATALGSNLAPSISAPPGLDYPLTLNGVTVTVGGRSARIGYVSPTSVNFILPNDLTPADLVEVVVNNNGLIFRGRVKVFDTAPGVYTTTNNGEGRALVRCGTVGVGGAIVYSDPPCAVGTEANPNVILITGTGWRNGIPVIPRIGDVDLTTNYYGGFDEFAPGVDAVIARLVPALAGKADVDIIIKTTVGSTNRDSKVGVKVSFQP